MGRLVLLLWYILSVLLHCFSCWREDCGQGRNLEPLVLFLERSCPVYVALALIQQGSHGPGLRDCQSSGGNLVWMGPGTGNGENHSSELQVPDPSSWVLLQYYCRNGILEGHVPCQLIQSAAAQN